MKEEKVSIKRRREEPQPTVEERETRAVLVAVIRDSQNPETATLSSETVTSILLRRQRNISNDTEWMEL